MRQLSLLSLVRRHRASAFNLPVDRGVPALALGLAAVLLAGPAAAQGWDEVRALSGRALSEAYANRATSADEAIGKLVRGYLAEQKIGTANTAVRFIPYRHVPIEESCKLILKGKQHRLENDELPSRVTLQWGRSPAGGLAVDTTLRYEVNDRPASDNALKFFTYPTLVAEPRADGRYHAQVVTPTGPVLAQLAAVGKLYRAGQTVLLGAHNSDYASARGTVAAVRLDDKVQRVVRDHFLPLESFVSHPRHAPRQSKARYKIGYVKNIDLAFVVQSRVYDVFLIRQGGLRLSRSEPWTFIQNAKTYNNPAYRQRLADLCVKVFPKSTTQTKVVEAEASEPPAATAGSAGAPRAARGRLAREWGRELQAQRRSSARSPLQAGLRQARIGASAASPQVRVGTSSRAARIEDDDLADRLSAMAPAPRQRLVDNRGEAVRDTDELRKSPIFSGYPDIE